MRNIRFSFIVLLAAIAFSASACTNPVGPKPTGDNVAGSGI